VVPGVSPVSGSVAADGAPTSTSVAPFSRNTSYPARPLPPASVDAAQVSVAPVDVTADATGVPGAVGAVVSGVTDGSWPQIRTPFSYAGTRGFGPAAAWYDGSFVGSQVPPSGTPILSWTSIRCADCPAGAIVWPVQLTSTYQRLPEACVAEVGLGQPCVYGLDTSMALVPSRWK
jgi:hypothetical protein